MSDVAAAVLQPTACHASQPAPAAASTGPTLWSHGGFSFKDLLDIVNPLQHLPIVGSIYRYLTGDEPSGGARIVGDAIYGGPIGFGVGVVTTMLTDRQGEDLGEQMLASVFGPSSAERDNDTSVAKAGTPSSPNLVQTAGLAESAPAPAGPASKPAAPQQATNSPSVAQSVRLAARLYRSPKPDVSVKQTPEQRFLAKSAQFQRQMTTTRTADGRVLNNRPIPLELSGNLMPRNRLALMPANPRVQPKLASPATRSATGTQGTVPATNPIAQKMLEALDKYEQLKKKQEQEDSAKSAEPPKVDLSL